MEPTEELYRKVYIKTERDLPKEDGKYYFHIIGNSLLRFLSTESASFRQLKKRVDYYLQPVEQDPDADIPKHPTSYRDFSMNDEIEKEQSEIKTAEAIEAIFKNTERIHGKSEALDWIKIAAYKSAKYLIRSQFKIELPTEEPQRADPGNLFEWVKDWIKQKRGL